MGGSRGRWELCGWVAGRDVLNICFSLRHFLVFQYFQNAIYNTNITHISHSKRNVKTLRYPTSIRDFRIHVRQRLFINDCEVLSEPLPVRWARPECCSQGWLTQCFPQNQVTVNVIILLWTSLSFFPWPYDQQAAGKMKTRPFSHSCVDI